MISESYQSPPDRYQAITRSTVSRMPQWQKLDRSLKEAIHVVSRVLPFRTNAYVVNELIQWDRVPEDPMFQLTFPQKGMLLPEDYERVRKLISEKAPQGQLNSAINGIRYKLNPHPAGQMTLNVPRCGDEALPGVQHKYHQTVLFFPSHGQTCHAYCTFCFRWAQFVGIDELKFSNRQVDRLIRYLREHREVTDVLFTGGDPMIMKADILRKYVEPLLEAGCDHVQSIRFGTKAPAYWPARFVTDSDADDLLRLFEEIVASGKHLALMGHYNHPVELSTQMARRALERIGQTGAVVRMQSPLIRHINDSPQVWSELWQTGVKLGAIPYYMFIERDTGARDYFEVPLVQAWKIFRKAYQDVSGLARTVRGPSMSASPGKVHILGVSEVDHQKVFVLEYLQARQPDLVRQPFFARYKANATWFEELEPASKRDERYFPHLCGKSLQTIPIRASGSLAV